MEILQFGLQEIAVLCMAAVNSFWDIRKKEILFSPTILFAAAGVIYGIASSKEPAALFGGMIPGLMLMAFSAASRGAVGFGDALFLLSAGAWTGWKAAALMFFTALMIQSAASVVYKLAGGRKKELPFIPAMFAGYLLWLILFQHGS